MNAAAKALILLTVSALALLILSAPDSSEAAPGWENASTEAELIEKLDKGITNISIIPAKTDDSRKLTIESDITIPANVRVLLPYGVTDMSGLALGDSEASYKIAGKDKVFVELTVNGKLNVKGQLIVGGILGKDDTFAYQGHTSSWHSVIVNNGTIKVENGGTLYCYGFIRGSGEVVGENGSKVMEPLIITDFSGGDNMLSSHRGNQAFFNRYSLSNIRCPLQIDYGSTLNGKLAICVGGTVYENQITYIGEKDTFIKLSEGASARLTYDATKSIESNESLGLHSDIGKTTITLNGGCSFEAIELVLDINGESGVYSFAEHPFPIPYNIDMVLENGNYLMNEDFRILPGAKLTIVTNATLAVNNSLSVFWGLKDKNYKDDVEVNMKYPTTETLASNGFDKSGRLIVCGNLILLDSSEFSGIAEMGSASATITTSKRTDTSLKIVEHGCTRDNDSFTVMVFGLFPYTMTWTVDTLTTREMAGYIVDSTGALSILQPDSIYRASSQTNYCMEKYIQDGTEYALGSDFKGGWILSSGSYQTITSSIPGNLTGEKVNLMLTSKGISQDFIIDLTVDSLKKVTVEQSAVASIRDGNGALRLRCDGISITFSAESLKNISGTLEIRLNDAALNDAQKTSAQDRATYYLEVLSDGKKIDIFHGVVTIVLPFKPHSEADKEKVQAWKIDTNGIAHTYRAAYSNNEISFATASAGCYAISLDNVPERSTVQNAHHSQTLMIAAGAATAIIAGLLIYFFLIRKKR